MKRIMNLAYIMIDYEGSIKVVYIYLTLIAVFTTEAENVMYADAVSVFINR